MLTRLTEGKDMSTRAPETIRVLSVDDHPAVRAGVEAMIASEPGIDLVGEASNGSEAIEQFVRLRPDVTLMDLQMPVVSGIEAIRAIRARNTNARIVVLTTYEGDIQAVEAIRAGASAYLLKSALRRELLDTIRAVHAGRRYIPPAIAQEIAFHVGEEPLSAREIQILKLVADGEANKQIAWRLTLSEDTIKNHLRSIFLKLDVNDRTEAVTRAVRRGLIML